MIFSLRIAALSILMTFAMSSIAQRPGPKLPSTGVDYEMYNGTAKGYLKVKEGKVLTESSAGEEGKWQFISLGNKGYHIYNNKTKQYLTAPSSNPETSALVMADKPTANSKWYVTLGVGMNSKYLFISNAQNKLNITGSGRSDISITHRKNTGGSGKMFSWRLVAK